MNSSANANDGVCELRMHAVNWLISFLCETNNIVKSSHHIYSNMWMVHDAGRNSLFLLVYEHWTIYILHIVMLRLMLRLMRFVSSYSVVICRIKRWAINADESHTINILQHGNSRSLYERNLTQHYCLRSSIYHSFDSWCWCCDPYAVFLVRMKRV